MSGPPYWFFTSYSELPERRGAVLRFHQDVETEVRAQLGKRTRGSGFVDLNNLRPGDRWRYRIQEGVCTARTMLALYCPSYFQSEWCAREWSVFTERIRRNRAAGEHGAYLFAVIWGRGPGDWPEIVREHQWVAGEPGSPYEESGLFHLVPEAAAGGEDYRQVVRKVAGAIAVTIHQGAGLAVLPREEARGLTPRFGPGLLRSVQFVVAYADADAARGAWAVEALALAGYSVDSEIVSASSLGTVDRVRKSLVRAERVLVMVSGTFFAQGDMSVAGLDEALADGSSDWRRLVPVLVDDLPADALPAAFRASPYSPLSGLDEETAKAVLFDVAGVSTAPARPPAGSPGLFPGAGTRGAGSGGGPGYGNVYGNGRSLQKALVAALESANSVSDPLIRPIWLGMTRLDPGLYDEGLPLRVLLFQLVMACGKVRGGYAVLADALADLEGDSDAVLQARRVIDGPGNPAREPTRSM